MGLTGVVGVQDHNPWLLRGRGGGWNIFLGPRMMKDFGFCFYIIQSFVEGCLVYLHFNQEFLLINILDLDLDVTHDDRKTNVRM